MMDNFSDSMDSDIVKKGYMMIKRPPSSGKVRIKAWQSRFFLLRDFSENSRQRLEYYKDQNTFQASRDEKHRPNSFIFLDNVIHIGGTNTSKTQPHAFMIVCSTQGALTLACNTQESRDEWLAALNRVSIKVQPTGLTSLWIQGNASEDSAGSTPETPRRSPSLCGSAVDGCAAVHTSQAYLVTTRLTPPAERNDIRGEYVMRVTEEDVLLKCCAQPQLAARWPLKYLRAFKNEVASLAETNLRHLITLEVGRRTATGEGIFQFFTDYGDDIIALIRLHSNLVLQSTAAEKREVFRRRAISSVTSKTQSIQQTDGSTCKKKISLPARLGSPEPTRPDPPGDKGRPVLRQSPVETNTIVQAECVKEPGTDNHKPRLASHTDSSEDDVFIKKSLPDSGNPTEGGPGESQDTPDSAYVVLLSDENAEPIHISDAGPRKGSASSQVSVVNGDERKISRRSARSASSSSDAAPRRCSASSLASVVHSEETRSARGTRSSASCPSEDSEVDGEEYVKSDMFPEKDVSPRRKIGSKLSGEDSEVSHNIKHKDIFFPPKVAANQVSAHSKIPPKPEAGKNACEDASSPDAEDNERESANQELLNKILAQMELPQQHDVREIFPSASAKRDSVPSGTGSDMPRGHQRSNDTAPETKATNQDPGSSPPPLPARPEMTAPRSKSFSALSEMADELRGRIDLTGTGNPTVFAKRMRQTPTLLGGPRGSIPKDVMLNARLLEQSLFAKNSPLPSSQINGEKPKSTEKATDTRECVSDNVVIVPKTVETAENLTSSSEKTFLVTKCSEAVDVKGEEYKKRKDSKASTMVKRLFKNMARSPPHSPACRRDSSDSYASEDCSEDDLEQPRRHSLAPGFFGSTRVGSRSPEDSPVPARKLSGEGAELRKHRQVERKWSNCQRESKSSKQPTDEVDDGNCCDLPRKFSLLTPKSVLEENTEEAAPALPPRIKTDPPPLPPRRPKSPILSKDQKCGSSLCKQRLSCPNKEVKLFIVNRGSNTCPLQSMPPPPLPPRRESAPPMLRSSAVVPEIYSTISSSPDPSCAGDSSSADELDASSERPSASPGQWTGHDCPVPARPPKSRKLGKGSLVPVRPEVDAAGTRDSQASDTREVVSALNNNKVKQNRYFATSSPEVMRRNTSAGGNGTVPSPDGRAFFVLEDKGHGVDSSGAFSSSFSTEA